MIIDSFLFFNEVDMLEKRLQYLNGTVDYFVIVEGACTFTGIDRELEFPKHVHRYAKYLHKILYFPFVMDKTGLDYTVRPNEWDSKHAAWQTEYAQRNHMLTATKLFSDDSIIVMSDLDEIPDRKKIILASKMLSQSVPSIILYLHNFNYNFKRVQSYWCKGPIITTAQNLRKIGPQALRNARDSIPSIEDGGWHLSYFFSAEKIQEKFRSFAHQEYNTEEFTNLDTLNRRIENNEDIVGRSIVKSYPFDVNALPPDFRKIFVD